MLGAIVAVNDNILNNNFHVSCKKVFKEITTIYIIIAMVETEINNYINKKCYDCCHLNMELYRLSLPNGIVNNTIDYSMDEEDECKICQEWRDNQELIRCHLNLKRRHNRNVEDDIIIFLTVYERPPYSYVRIFLKISKKKYEMIKHILWMLLHRRREGCDLKDIKSYIESNKFNVKNTVRDINIIFELMHDTRKIFTQFNNHQLTYYPELKL